MLFQIDMKDFEHFNLDPQENQQKDWVSSPNVTRTDKTLVVKDFFIADDTNVRFLRGQIINRKVFGSNSTLSSVYTMAVTDFLLGVTSLAYTPSVGLPRPSLVGIGKTYIVKDEVGGAASTTITIQSDGEKTIDGAASTTLTTNYQSKSFYSDGSNWFIY